MKKLSYNEAFFVEKSFLDLLESTGVLWPYKGYEKVVKILDRELERAEKREAKKLNKAKRIVDASDTFQSLTDIHAAITTGKSPKKESMEVFGNLIEKYGKKKELELSSDE